MEKSDLLEAALDKMINELDEIEGSGAMSHSAEDCPDPLGCTMHDDENGENLEKGSPAAVSVEVHKMGLPSMEADKPEEEGKKAEDGLSPEEAEELRKLLK